MRNDITLAGKTGTAEIKASKGDTSGTELAGLPVYTADGPITLRFLWVSMVEDVKNAGGAACGEKDESRVINFLYSSGAVE